MSEVPIIYEKNFVPEPNRVLQVLKNELEWERRNDAPRSEYYCNDFNEPYTYGSGRGRRTYLVRPYHPEILAIRALLEAYAKCKFEVCFLNLYLNQSDSLNWHSDSSPEMDNKRPIATISVGAERYIWFCPKNDSKNVTRLKLENGSMCLMAPGMQETHLHRIPKADFQCGERISLTFRGYVLLGKNDVGEEGRV